MKETRRSHGQPSKARSDRRSASRFSSVRHIGLASTLPTGMPRSWKARPMARASSRPFAVRFRWLAQSVGPRDFEIILAQIGCSVPKIEHIPAFAQLGYECCRRKLLSWFRAARRCGWNDCETVVALLGERNASATSAQNAIDAFMHYAFRLRHQYDTADDLTGFQVAQRCGGLLELAPRHLDRLERPLLSQRDQLFRAPAGFPHRSHECPYPAV